MPRGGALSLELALHGRNAERLMQLASWHMLLVAPRASSLNHGDVHAADTAGGASLVLRCEHGPPARVDGVDTRPIYNIMVYI